MIDSISPMDPLDRNRGIANLRTYDVLRLGWVGCRRAGVVHTARYGRNKLRGERVCEGWRVVNGKGSSTVLQLGQVINKLLRLQ
jgi:hypothetical protein